MFRMTAQKHLTADMTTASMLTVYHFFLFFLLFLFIFYFLILFLLRLMIRILSVFITAKTALKVCNKKF